MSADEENPDPDVTSIGPSGDNSDGERIRAPETMSSERNANDTAESNVTEVSAPRTMTDEEVDRIFFEFLELGNSSSGDDNDDEQGPSRCTLCCVCFRERINRVMNIIAYPFVVLFTIISLIMIVTFCIIPTMICMVLGICAYYCFMDDPIPLHLLLRYMFSPDNEADTAFGNGDGSSAYPLAYNRSLIQSKLIVRRLTEVTSSGTKNWDPKQGNDMTKKSERHRASPVFVWTESKCLQFSEPLVFDDDDSDGEKDEKKKSQNRRRRGRDASPNGNDDDVEGGTENVVSNAVPHYQRSVQRELSNRNINEIDPDLVPVERMEGGDELVIVAIPSGDENTSPITGTREESAIEADEEIGEAPISVGGEGDDAMESTGENDEGVSDWSHDETMNGGEETDTSKMQRSREDAASNSSPGDKDIGESTISSCRPASLEVDYFGIENDARDRHTTCDICLLEYEVGDEVAWSPNLACSHTYHKDCILDWLVRKPTCPNCRHDYTKGKKDGRS